MNQKVDQLMEQAIERGIFPAASLLVGRGGGEMLHEGYYGKARAGTVFDIASLTKPISTATLAMQLIQEGLVKLEDSVYQWLGGARLGHHKKMTLAHLLSHTSGLPAWQPFYRELPIDQVGTKEGKQHIIGSCLKEPVVTEPGFQCLYSDLGYIILGEILEQAGLASLDILFQNRIATPLGLKDTFFNRVIGFSPESRVPSPESRKRFAPTEDCPWRGHVLHGEVHDQNAYAMGGVAGHAGLFSTARDIHKFITEFLKCYRGESDWLSPKIVRQFIDDPSRATSNACPPAVWREQRATFGTYLLGWDTPTFGSSSSGRYFSPHSIGHLGYTGCSIWIDLDKNFWIILLTNRIHPETTNEKIRAFRPRIHDLCWKELME